MEPDSKPMEEAKVDSALKNAEDSDSIKDEFIDDKPPELSKSEKLPLIPINPKEIEIVNETINRQFNRQLTIRGTHPFFEKRTNTLV